MFTRMFDQVTVREVLYCCHDELSTEEPYFNLDQARIRHSAAKQKNCPVS